MPQFIVVGVVMQSVAVPFNCNLIAGNPYRRERLSTVDLHIKMGCFVKKENGVLS